LRKELPVTPYQIRRLACVAVLVVIAAAEPGLAAAWLRAAGARLESVEANDNVRPGGTLDARTLTLSLRAGVGSWKPEGAAGAALQIEAFGELTSALMVPGPLIRVVEGAAIVASIRNDLDAPLMIHGLCARDGTVGLQRHAAAKDRRIVSALTGSAEERYREFVKTYPSIAVRVPQTMIASYLGMTPETISRIRRNRSRRTRDREMGGIARGRRLRAAPGTRLKPSRYGLPSSPRRSCLYMSRASRRI
jgi:hypothetical protein